MRAQRYLRLESTVILSSPLWKTRWLWVIVSAFFVVTGGVDVWRTYSDDATGLERASWKFPFDQYVRKLRFHHICGSCFVICAALQKWGIVRGVEAGVEHASYVKYHRVLGRITIITSTLAAAQAFMLAV